jgi:predicted TPR repeat methyltransferase
MRAGGKDPILERAKVKPGAALFVSSGDLVADRRFGWALDQAARGDLAAAAEILLQTLELTPEFTTAWFTLGAIRDRLGDREGAIAAFRQARDYDVEDYHGARLQLARLGADDVNPAMTAVYVQRLFDQHAPNFDQSLLERLDYRAPELLRAALEEACRKAARPFHFASLLDLGCGTGLSGAAFRDVTDHMVGMDLSAGMLAEAKAKEIYDRLDEGELVEYVSRPEWQGANLELIVAADVFVYVADLAPSLAAIAGALARNGLLAFTVETHDGEGSKLGTTLRYAHARDYVWDVLNDAGWEVVTLRKASTRTEKGEPVPGLVVVAKKI